MRVHVELFAYIFQLFVWGYVQVCLLASQSVGGSQMSTLFLRVPEVCLFRPPATPLLSSPVSSIPRGN